MTLRSFLYLTQLEEYDTKRIYTWLANNPNREVTEIKKQLVWTNKIRLLSFIAHLLFFLPPERSVLLGLQLLHSSFGFFTINSGPLSSLVPGAKPPAKTLCSTSFQPNITPNPPPPIKTPSSESPKRSFSSPATPRFLSSRPEPTNQAISPLFAG